MGAQPASAGLLEPELPLLVPLAEPGEGGPGRRPPLRQRRQGSSSTARVGPEPASREEDATPMLLGSQQRVGIPGLRHLSSGTGSFEPLNSFPAGREPNSVALGDFGGQPTSVAVGSFVTDGLPGLAVTISPPQQGSVATLLNSCRQQGDLRVRLSEMSFVLAPAFLAASGCCFSAAGEAKVGSSTSRNSTPGTETTGGGGSASGGSTASASSGSSTSGGVAELCAAPSFRAQTTFAVGAAPKSVATGDFNEDGHLDLVVANAGGDSVSLLLGTGSGSFEAQSPLPCRPGQRPWPSATSTRMGTPTSLSRHSNP